MGKRARVGCSSRCHQHSSPHPNGISIPVAITNYQVTIGLSGTQQLIPTQSLHEEAKVHLLSCRSPHTHIKFRLASNQLHDSQVTPCEAHAAAALLHVADLRRSGRQFRFRPHIRGERASVVLLVLAQRGGGAGCHTTCPLAYPPGQLAVQRLLQRPALLVALTPCIVDWGKMFRDLRRSLSRS